MPAFMPTSMAAGLAENMLPLLESRIGRIICVINTAHLDNIPTGSRPFARRNYRWTCLYCDPPPKENHGSRGMFIMWVASDCRTVVYRPNHICPIYGADYERDESEPLSALQDRVAIQGLGGLS